MRGWILVSLLLFSSVFIAAATEDAQVAAAVGSAIGTEPSATPASSPGFIDGRLDDIKKRVEPIARTPKRTAAYGPQGHGFGPQDGRFDQGPRYGPDYGGGPQYDEGYGPSDDFGPGMAVPAADSAGPRMAVWTRTARTPIQVRSSRPRLSCSVATVDSNCRRQYQTHG